MTKLTSKVSAAAKKLTKSPKHKILGGERGGGSAHMKILNAGAAKKTTLNKNLDRKLVPVLTGIRGRSTIRNAIAFLKKGGLIEVTKESLIVTDEGMKEADPSAICNANIPTTNTDYQNSVKLQYNLKAKAIELFDTISDGRIYTKNYVASAIGMHNNSTWRNMLANLKGKVIEYRGKDSIQLIKDMFPFEPRPE